jgi:adenylate cyclase
MAPIPGIGWTVFVEQPQAEAFAPLYASLWRTGGLLLAATVFAAAAMDMQEAIQRLIAEWRLRGHVIGFGIGLAMGWATVGRIGYEARVDYTAIGRVVNLASRLCSSANDQQILIDHSVAHCVHGKIPMVALGARDLKGFDEQVAVYDVGTRSAKSDVASDPNEIGAKS